MKKFGYLARLAAPMLVLGSLIFYADVVDGNGRIPFHISIIVALLMGFLLPKGSWRWVILIGIGVDLAHLTGNLIDATAIPNKFPITDLHEVIIHSPDHDMSLVSMPLAQLELVLKAYRERYNFYRKSGQVIIFCNHGDASGASLQHYHSQLVVIPNQINLDALQREPLANIVTENKFFNVWCPDFSQWPYEVWIAPKVEKTYFGDIADEEIADLSAVMQDTFKQLKRIYEKNPLSDRGFNFNYYIYPKENWYMRVIPRFIHRAGFELGTGLSVNIVDPRDAAIEFRQEEKQTAKAISKEDRMKNVMGKLLGNIA